MLMLNGMIGTGMYVMMRRSWDKSLGLILSLAGGWQGDWPVLSAPQSTQEPTKILFQRILAIVARLEGLCETESFDRQLNGLEGREAFVSVGSTVPLHQNLGYATALLGATLKSTLICLKHWLHFNDTSFCANEIVEGREEVEIGKQIQERSSASFASFARLGPTIF